MVTVPAFQLLLEKQNLIKLEKSVLVIAHATMLNNEYKIIKETLFKDFEKIK